jgi:hypothetical protein
LIASFALLVTPPRADAVIITDGLLYEWTLDEIGGTTATDSIAGRDMQSFGGPTTGVPGIEGTAYSFDGTDDYLAAPSANETFGTGDFTICAWIRTSSPQTKVADIFLHQGDAGWFELYLNYDGTPAFYGQDYHTNGYFFADGTAPINDGRWHLVSLVRQGDSVFLYVGAQEVASVLIPQIQTLSGTGGLLIGGASYGSHYLGLIDDVAVYDRALSPAEIASNAVPEPSAPVEVFGGIAGLLAIARRRWDPCEVDSTRALI